MKLGRFAQKYAPSQVADAAIPAISAKEPGQQGGTLAGIATIAASAHPETRSSGVAGRVSTLGRDGRLHPRLAALIGAYCKRHQFTREDLQEALDMAARAADPAAAWAFYETADRDGDDRIACPMCARLAGVQCAAKGFAPVLDIRRRCGDYTPAAGDPDRRTGELRWPGLME